MAETVFKFLFEGGGAGGTGGAGGGASGPAGGGSAPSATRSAAQAADAGGSALGSLAKGIALAANVVQGNVTGTMTGLASLAGVGGPITAVISGFQAVAGVVNAFDAAMQANIETLKKYSPAISASEARAKVDKMLQDRGRAEEYGDQLASYNDSEARRDRAWTDIKDDVTMPFLELRTDLNNFAADLMEGLHGKDNGEGRKSIGERLADLFDPLSNLKNIARHQQTLLSVQQDLARKGSRVSIRQWFKNLPTIEGRVLDRQHKAFNDDAAKLLAPRMEFQN